MKQKNKKKFFQSSLFIDILLEITNKNFIFISEVITNL